MSGRLTRWPVAPLLAYVEVAHGPGNYPDLGRLSDAEVAVIVGATPDAVATWRRRGWLTEANADRIGVDLVGSPALLWPDWSDGIDWSDLDDLEAVG